MTKDIFVAAGGTVTIETEEYRELLKRSACLDVILGFLNDPKSYILSDVCCVVDVLLNKPVITDDEGEDEDDNPEITAVLNAANEGADDHA